MAERPSRYGPDLHYDWLGNPIDMLTWAKLFKDERHIAEDTIEGVKVSTVYMGLDHSFGEGPPLIFETMVFAGDDPEHPLDQYTERYATEKQARAGHARVLAEVKATTGEVANGS